MNIVIDKAATERLDQLPAGTVFQLGDEYFILTDFACESPNDKANTQLIVRLRDGSHKEASLNLMVTPVNSTLSISHDYFIQPF